MLGAHCGNVLNAQAMFARLQETMEKTAQFNKLVLDDLMSSWQKQHLMAASHLDTQPQLDFIQSCVGTLDVQFLDWSRTKTL